MLIGAHSRELPARLDNGHDESTCNDRDRSEERPPMKRCRFGVLTARAQPEGRSEQDDGHHLERIKDPRDQGADAICDHGGQSEDGSRELQFRVPQLDRQRDEKQPGEQRVCQHMEQVGSCPGLGGSFQASFSHPGYDPEEQQLTETEHHEGQREDSRRVETDPSSWRRPDARNLRSHNLSPPRRTRYN